MTKCSGLISILTEAVVCAADLQPFSFPPGTFLCVPPPDPPGCWRTVPCAVAGCP